MKKPRSGKPAPIRESETQSRRDLVEAVRGACIAAAIQAYEDAAVSGLCHEGAFEAAISAMRRADLERIPEDRS